MSLNTTVEVTENVWTVEVTPEIGETVTIETPGETLIQIFDEAAQGLSGANGRDGRDGRDGAPGVSGDYNLLTNKPPLSVVYEFTNSSVIEFDHNMRKYPAVRVEDSAGTYWIGRETFLSLDRVRIEFSVSFSGRVILS